MDHLGLVAGLQVPEDGGVVEEGQVDHVLALLELRRVDPAHVGGLEVELLVSNRHNHLDTGSKLEMKCHDYLFGGILQVDVSSDEETLLVAMGLLVLDPDGGLGVVGLLLVGPLHVQAGEQELGGVGVDRALDKLDVARHGEAEMCKWLLDRGRIRQIDT